MMHLKRKKDKGHVRRTMDKPNAAVFPRDLELELGIEGWVGFLPVEMGQMLGGSVLSSRGPVQFKREERKVRNKMPVSEREFEILEVK